MGALVVLYFILVIITLCIFLSFSICYHTFIPSWIKNPFGRMIQFQAWSLILFLGFTVIRVSTGHTPGPEAILIWCLLMFLIGFGGFWQTVMLIGVIRQNIQSRIEFVVASVPSEPVIESEEVRTPEITDDV